ncbi:HAMP domain-containing sensor histidine kinase [Parasulfuritortus cantonensis]|uniref:histidine kinase n=1 Tax=Parasulfuritortus cantonensis TaxID=2528202 RepID=A0A4R1BR62_9PROT|nr:HAMP domain-containing sensor histidine kinase [Parasulfuritortus cantonensis]TCJ20243.1 HAMP domain-containing sensor histidine kinase [Parasulfuritortus cantonensis]
MSSLRQKIILGYSVFALLLVGLSGLYYLESRLTERQIQAGAAISEFFDVALELRRFEKNYFLFGQAGDLAANRAYAARAGQLLGEERTDFEKRATPAHLARLRQALDRYAAAMSDYAGRPGPERAQAVRELGLAIVNDAQELAASERTALHAGLAHQRTFLLATLFGLLGLLGVAAVVVSGGIVRPLQEMERRMEMVAAGDKARLNLATARDREIAALARAFNHVLDEVSLRQQEKLIQADHLAALGRLISGVAHEVNNPLSNISSSAQILLEDGDSSGPEWRHEMLAQIDAETVRAQRIVRSLLDYAREREFRRQPVPLKAALEETLLFLRNDLPAGVGFRLDIPDDLVVPADKPRLQQAFLNLLKNAVEAQTGPGEIRVAAAVRGADALPCPREQDEHRAPAEAVEIEVRDHGQGIPADVLAHVFEPFYTTKSASQGSGLGLFIVREIVEEHGGCIDAESVPGADTVFRIRLPRRIDTPKEPS